jgi:hypothetical protein
MRHSTTHPQPEPARLPGAGRVFGRAHRDVGVAGYLWCALLAPCFAGSCGTRDEMIVSVSIDGSATSSTTAGNGDEATTSESDVAANGSDSGGSALGGTIVEPVRCGPLQETNLVIPDFTLCCGSVCYRLRPPAPPGAPDVRIQAESETLPAALLPVLSDELGLLSAVVNRETGESPDSLVVEIVDRSLWSETVPPGTSLACDDCTLCELFVPETPEHVSVSRCEHEQVSTIRIAPMNLIAETPSARITTTGSEVCGMYGAWFGLMILGDERPTFRYFVTNGFPIEVEIEWASTTECQHLPISVVITRVVAPFSY